MANRKKGGLFRAALALIVLAGLILAYATVFQPWAQRQRYAIHYEQQIAHYAQKNGLDPYLVCAMIFCESSFKSDARSSVGALGLMQIMPETGAWLAHKVGIDDFDASMLYDPQVNMELGCWYLAFLLDRYAGDRQCAVAAYHGGQGNMDGWLQDPSISADGKTLDNIPEGETKKYTNRVLKVYEIYQQLYPDRFQ